MLKKMRIGMRMGLGFGVMISIAVILSVVAINELQSIAGLIVKIYKHPFAVRTAALQANVGILEMHRSMKDVALATEASQIDAAVKAVDASEKEVLANGAIVMERFLGDKSKVQAILDTFRSWKPVRDEVISLKRAGEVQKAAQITKEKGAAIVASLDKMLEELNNMAQTRADSIQAEAARAAERALYLIFALGLASLVFGLLLAWRITRGVTLPLRRTIEGLTGASDQMAAGSSQIASAAQQLAEGASEQAASIEETSSSLEEMASMTRKNADHAHQAEALMMKTQVLVRQASDSMVQLTTSMDGISRASEETSKIVKTIDEIAFQTNLLALNAAVEAARAGEAGAGFAVVADEVRNLAMRAAEAAKNTSSLIEDTVKRINQGSQVVEKTTADFTQVADSSSRMGELVGEITAASSEQALGIEHINKAVNEMDRIVQQNAANAEESASSSEEMSAQAECLIVYVENLSSLVRARRSNGHDGERPPGFARTEGDTPQREIPRRKTLSNMKLLQHHSRKETGPQENKTREISAARVIPLDEEAMNDF